MRKSNKLVMLIIVSVFLLVGCSEKDNKKKEEGIVNNYTETEVQLPKDVYNILSIIELDNGNLEMIASTKKISGLKYEYKKETKTWEEKGSVSNQLDTNSLIMKANQIDEGGYFIEYYKGDSNIIEYARISSAGDMTEIPIKLPQEFLEQNICYTYCDYTNDGVICTTSNGDGRFFLLNMENGEVEQEYYQGKKTDYSTAFILNDNLVVVRENGIDTFNVSSGELLDVDKQLAEFLTEQVYSVFCVNSTSADIFRLNAEGISGYSLTKNQKEDLMKKRTNTYSKEGVSITGALLCENNNIITYQTENNAGCSITEFIYSEKGYKEKE